MHRHMLTAASAPSAPLRSFPGWLAPLNFNPDRFLEFLSFTGTVCGVWVAAALLTGGYAYATTAGRLPRALKTAALIWAVSMPVAAAQLVLVAATESRSLVGARDPNPACFQPAVRVILWEHCPAALNSSAGSAYIM